MRGEGVSWEGRGCTGRDGTSAQKGTVGLEPQPLVENVLEAEQQETVQGTWQVQLRQDQKQPALQEGPECAASQVLQGARSLLQGEKWLVETWVFLQREKRGPEADKAEDITLGAEVEPEIPLP